MPTSRRWSLDAVRYEQVASFLCFAHIFVCQTFLNSELEYVIKQIISRGFGYHPQYQPSTVISRRTLDLWLRMGSWVDTLGNGQTGGR